MTTCTRPTKGIPITSICVLLDYWQHAAARRMMMKCGGVMVIVKSSALCEKSRRCQRCGKIVLLERNYSGVLQYSSNIAFPVMYSSTRYDSTCTWNILLILYSSSPYVFRPPISNTVLGVWLRPSRCAFQSKNEMILLNFFHCATDGSWSHIVRPGAVFEAITIATTSTQSNGNRRRRIERKWKWLSSHGLVGPRLSRCCSDGISGECSVNVARG
jgi:hypothetical protein